MIIFIILISLWFISGVILGYIFNVVLEKSIMTIDDILLSGIAGLLNLIAIWNKYVKNIVIFKPKIKEESKKE